MPTDYFVEELPDGGALQPADLMHVQRNVSGTWTDYQIEHGNVRGGGVQVIDMMVEDADFTINFAELLPFVSGKGVVIVDPPIVWVFNASPTNALETINIGASAIDDCTVNFTNDDPEQVTMLSFGTGTVLGGLFIQRSTGLGTAGASFRVRLSYVLADI